MPTTAPQLLQERRRSTARPWRPSQSSSVRVAPEPVGRAISSCSRTRRRGRPVPARAMKSSLAAQTKRTWATCSKARLLREDGRSEEHTSELQSPCNLVCRLLLEKKKKYNDQHYYK